MMQGYERFAPAGSFKADIEPDAIWLTNGGADASTTGAGGGKVAGWDPGRNGSVLIPGIPGSNGLVHDCRSNKILPPLLINHR